MAPVTCEARRATVESYNRTGSGYQVHIDCDWRRALDEYTLLPLLDSLQLAGRTVLDVGAGTGRWTRAALRRGAAEVYALEPSVKMADAARQIENQEQQRAKAAAGGDSCSSWSVDRVHHMLGDVVDSDLSTLAADVAVIGYVLQHVDSANHMLSALRNVHSALRSGGHLVGVSVCVEEDEPPKLHSPMPRYSLILPEGNVEWRTANATLTDPPFQTTIFVQRWATLRRLMEEAGFRCIERVESRVDEALLSDMTAEEAAAMLRHARRCAFFYAQK